jgi:type IV secretory pathway TraG/TraD family ATPase VirD4
VSRLEASPEPPEFSKRLPNQLILGYNADSLVHKRAWVQAAPRVAGLVVGPPTAGKTRRIIVPNVLGWDGGPAVVTSTRHDVLRHSLHGRAQLGTVWLFDPMGAVGEEWRQGVHLLHWSPLRGCERWDVAMQRATDLSIDTGKGVENGLHWQRRGAQLLAVLLHAAALAGEPMSTVVRWVQARDFDPSEDILAREDTKNQSALAVQGGLRKTPDRERASIWSSVDGTLAAFNRQDVSTYVDAARSAEPFDAEAFLQEVNTLFIVTASDVRTTVAPLTVGLVEEVRTAALRLSDRSPDGMLTRPLLLALDEAANICPLPTLSQILTEGGGRNIVSLISVQDLTQIASTWDEHFARGILSHAGAKILLGGIGDPETLAKFEQLCGNERVEFTSYNVAPEQKKSAGLFPADPQNVSRGGQEHLMPRFTVDDIRQLKVGEALVINSREAPLILNVPDFSELRG